MVILHATGYPAAFPSGSGKPMSRAPKRASPLVRTGSMEGPEPMPPRRRAESSSEKELGNVAAAAAGIPRRWRPPPHVRQRRRLCARQTASRSGGIARILSGGGSARRAAVPRRQAFPFRRNAEQSSTAKGGLMTSASRAHCCGSQRGVLSDRKASCRPLPRPLSDPAAGQMAQPSPGPAARD